MARSQTVFEWALVGFTELTPNAQRCRIIRLEDRIRFYRRVVPWPALIMSLEDDLEQMKRIYEQYKYRF